MLKAYAKAQAYLNSRRVVEDEEGATAVEYGLIVGLIAVAIIVAVIALGGNLSTMFQDIADKIGEVVVP
ncbi:Flp family type IVb pilin [Microbacterium bovistercoris]|uniref:Flp family type IVb pilin n=1 Tax=Microbacterium bovistercoris TaxID=2293570 RepID=A0A371NQE6_9MICO|nr:Flp family type IVb pilin [Microbacterium bovistercoris]REJ03927.1 Flp family type IVb pilin [Microbacterium bovistercoris]